jgi:hypothetical protein
MPRHTREAYKKISHISGYLAMWSATEYVNTCIFGDDPLVAIW